MIKMDPDLSLTQKVCHLQHFIKDFFCLWITLITTTKSVYFLATEIAKILHVCSTSTFLYFGMLLDFKTSVFNWSMPSYASLFLCVWAFFIWILSVFCYFRCFYCICLVLELLGKELVLDRYFGWFLCHY